MRMERGESEALTCQLPKCAGKLIRVVNFDYSFLKTSAGEREEERRKIRDVRNEMKEGRGERGKGRIVTQ